MAVQKLVAVFRLSGGGREEALATPASSRTGSPPPVLPMRTLVRGDLPEKLLSLLATTSGTRSAATLTA